MQMITMVKPVLTDIEKFYFFNFNVLPIYIVLVYLGAK